MNMMNKVKCLNGLNSKFCSVLGAQWGDEGKGKLIDVLAPNYDVVARFNGGSNAGHTIKVGENKFFCHIIPSGIVRPHIINIIGNGCVVNLDLFFNELKQLEDKDLKWKNKLFISHKAHLTVQGHFDVEKKIEDKLKIGTTKKAIGTTYATKILRTGLRFEDLLDENKFYEKYQEFYKYCDLVFGVQNSNKNEFDEILAHRKRVMDNNLIQDTSKILYDNIKNGKRILAEGANGTMLDIDHGSYPYVTSSNTCSGSICTGLGVSPMSIETIVAVVKAYSSRVGGGPMDTELLNETGDFLQSVGKEVGVTTGRKRRCGWLDLEFLRNSSRINGFSSINLTKLDVLTGLEKVQVKLEGGEYKEFDGWNEDIQNATSFDDLPKNCQNYVRFIEEYLDTPISWIGNGPDREQMIKLI